MTKYLVEILASITIVDLIDIALLTAIIYWLLLLIKGTRTIPILFGMTVLLATYGLAIFLGLEAIGWVMENLFNSVVVILVVLFQADIRNALAQVGISTMFRELSQSAQAGLIEEIVESASQMAKRRIGASIVLERDTGLRNYIERGKLINAEPTVDLLSSIFHTTSPLHDGAVIIDREGKLAAARCILPLSMNPVSSSMIGTRHRSAIGLTEETDAVVVIVSEERGVISLAYRGKLHPNLEPMDLRIKLSDILQGKVKDNGITEVSAKVQSA